MRNPYTRAVLQDCLTTWVAEMQDGESWEAIVRQWLEAYPTRDEAEVALACQLCQDFRAWYGGSTCPLARRVFTLAFQRTNWRKVARVLLKRFAPGPAGTRWVVTYGPDVQGSAWTAAACDAWIG